MHSKYLLAVYLCVGAFISKCLTAAFVNFETPHVHPIALSPDNELLAVCNTYDYKAPLKTSQIIDRQYESNLYSVCLFNILF